MGATTRASQRGQRQRRCQCPHGGGGGGGGAAGCLRARVIRSVSWRAWRGGCPKAPEQRKQGGKVGGGQRGPRGADGAVCRVPARWARVGDDRAVGGSDRPIGTRPRAPAAPRTVKEGANSPRLWPRHRRVNGTALRLHACRRRRAAWHGTALASNGA